MNTEEKNKEIDINEVAITLEVDSEVIDKVRSGEITHILMDISEDNQSLVLETIDGNLILVTDEMPTTFHGCYVTRKVIGKVKMTVGIRRRTHEKVQYCITAIQAT